MKITTYLRIAQGGRRGYKVSASSTPVYEPLMSSAYNKRFLPTVFFAVNFDIPEVLFKQAEQVIGTIDVQTKQATVNSAILLPALRETLKKLESDRPKRIMKHLLNGEI